MLPTLPSVPRQTKRSPQSLARGQPSGSQTARVPRAPLSPSEKPNCPPTPSSTPHAPALPQRDHLDDWVAEQMLWDARQSVVHDPSSPGAEAGGVCGLRHFEKALTKALAASGANPDLLSLDERWERAAGMLDTVGRLNTVWGNADCVKTRTEVSKLLLKADPQDPQKESAAVVCAALCQLMDALCAFAPSLAGLGRVTLRRLLALVFVNPPPLPTSSWFSGSTPLAAFSGTKTWRSLLGDGGYVQSTLGSHQNLKAAARSGSLGNSSMAETALRNMPVHDRKREYLQSCGVTSLLEEAIDLLAQAEASDVSGFLATHFADRHAAVRVDPAATRVVIADQATAYLARTQALQDAEARKNFAMAIIPQLQYASPFGFFANERPGSARKFRFQAGSLYHNQMYPVQKRLAWVFLDQIGRIHPKPGHSNSTRSWDRSPNQDLLYHVPVIHMRAPVGDWPDDEREYVINAATIDSTTENVIDDELFSEHFPNGTGPSAERIYGGGEFRITRREIRSLEASTRLVTTGSLPARFFTELAGFTSSTRWAKYFSIFRSTPLTSVGTGSTSTALKEMYADRYDKELLAASTPLSERDRLREMVREATEAEKQKLYPRLGDKEHEVHQHRLWRDNAKSARDLLDDPVEIDELYQSFTRWLDNVQKNARDYGFESKSAAQQACSLSLVELATQVCLSQRGYFFVDGRNGNQNQIVSRPPEPVVFLSATGIDFNTPSTTILEATKYFRRPKGNETDSLPAYKGWRGFQDGAEERLVERVKQLYLTIFMSAQEHRVRNPSMLAMGLGAFLLNIHPADRQKVREAYFRAQFELLAQKDWGFEIYYLNAADHNQTAREVLESGVRDGHFNSPREGRFLRCTVVIHSRDAKFLAVELSKSRMGAAVINPSDCAGLMQGIVGNHWETGRSGYYGGEEDWAATGTGLLAHCGVSDTIRNIGRCIYVDATTQKLARPMRPPDLSKEKGLRGTKLPAVTVGSPTHK
eukprot:Hpha_TRINITY_DN3350_c0_g1::TRINITY_DN3350_c0_g1_i2::g.172369::m.172369